MSNTREGGSPGTSPAWASIPGSMRSTPQSPGGTGETSANAPVCARPGDFAMRDLSRAVILQLPDCLRDGPPGHGLTCRCVAGPSAGSRICEGFPGMPETCVVLLITQRRLVASRLCLPTWPERAHPQLESCRRRITRGVLPRSDSLTCTDTTTDRTQSAGCTGNMRPAVPRPVPRPSRSLSQVAADSEPDSAVLALRL